MSLVLKSNVSYTGASLSTDFDAYKARVLADGGQITNESSAISAFILLKELNIKNDDVFSMTSANWGAKIENGNIVKLYSLFNDVGDLTTVSGGYPVSVSDSGVSGFYSSQSSSNKMQSIGTMRGDDVGVFLAYKKGVAPGTTSTTLFELIDTTSYKRLANLIYVNDSDIFNADAFGTSGSLSNIAYAAGASVTANLQTGLTLYTEGTERGVDNTVTSIGDVPFNLFIASSPLSSGIGARGDYYATAVIKNIDDVKASKLSAYMSNFA